MCKGLKLVLQQILENPKESSYKLLEIIELIKMAESKINIQVIAFLSISNKKLEYIL